MTAWSWGYIVADPASDRVFGGLTVQNVGRGSR